VYQQAVGVLQRGRYDRSVRRLLTWVVVTLGIAEIVRRLRRRGQQEEIAPVRDDDPANELRRKLTESRTDEQAAAVEEPPTSPEASVEPPTSPEASVEEPPTSPEASVEEPPTSPEASVEKRRANVHEEGRATLDEMRDPDES
jgi:hypothetical protein